MKVKINTEKVKGKFIFYGNRRVYDGEVIELESPKHFTENCMVKIKKPRAKAKPEEVEPTQETE